MDKVKGSVDRDRRRNRLARIAKMKVRKPQQHEEEEEDSSSEDEQQQQQQPATDNKDQPLDVDALTQAFKGVNLNVNQSYTGWDNKNGKGFMKGLPEFEWNNIMDDALVLNIGKRRKGKTTLTDYLMYHKQHSFPGGIVFTHTKFNGFWQKRVPAQMIHEKYDPAVLKALFDRNKAIIEDPGSTVNPAMFVIIDDCVSQQELMYDAMLKELASAGRHYKLFTIINTQYAYGISPLIRGNADFVVLFKQAQKRQRDAVAEDFLDSIDKKAATALVDAVTKVKYQVLVVDIDEEQYYVGHCAGPDNMTEEQKHYKLGCREFWQNNVYGGYVYGGYVDGG